MPKHSKKSRRQCWRPVRCRICGTWFWAARAHAEFDSTRCRLVFMRNGQRYNHPPLQGPVDWAAYERPERPARLPAHLAERAKPAARR